MSKRFAFTSYLEDNWPLWKPDQMVYLVYQGEKCPETKRFHWQGYVEFKGSKRFKGVQEALGLPGCHLEKSRGTGEENRRYCTKPESRIEGPYEYGTMGPGQGKRSDLASLCEVIKKGASDEEIANLAPTAWLKYSRGVIALRAAVSQKRKWKTHITVAWGPTGTGKSKCADEMFPDAYWKPPGKWWDGYHGQKHVILDDFRPWWWDMEYMLRLMDRYPLRVETKGGTVEFVATHIFITSNIRPEEWYWDDKEKVIRRIDDCMHLDQPE